MAIAQLKEAREHLSQSLKRRKELAKEINDHEYVETKIEDLFPTSSSNEVDEANNAIKELLEKNGLLQKEVRMLRREQEIQSARFCEILEQRNKMQNEIEGRNNEIVQHEDLTEQLSNANEEIRILKEQNESLKNELDIQKQANERMMKSQTDLDQLNEQNLHKQKGKAGLGYNEEGESSEQGSQRNQRPTCNYCGKTGHTSNKCWSNGKTRFKGKCYSCNQHGHKASECKEKPKFEGKFHKCKKQGHKTSECRTKTFTPAEQIVKAIFGWDYNTCEGSKKNSFHSAMTSTSTTSRSKMKKTSNMLVKGVEWTAPNFKLIPAIAESLDPSGAQSRIPSKVLLINDICTHFKCTIQELGSLEMDNALSQLCVDKTLKPEHRHLEIKAIPNTPAFGTYDEAKARIELEIKLPKAITSTKRKAAKTEETEEESEETPKKKGKVVITKPKPKTAVFTRRTRKGQKESKVVFRKPPPTFEEKLKQLEQGSGMSNFKALKYESRSDAEKMQIKELLLNKMGKWKYTPDDISSQIPNELLVRIRPRWTLAVQTVKDIYAQSLK
ncbi:hypothetical protein SUGI_0969160 [Cryptomeria japonica]|nr:hypothetical protein SUGI_0969160 [Cryptomeria japonica]